MGIQQTVISDIRHRGRTITPETAAELADIAGEDAREAAISAIIERSKGTRREGAMREILGKALAAGAGAMSDFSYKGGLSGSMDPTKPTPIKAVRFTGLYIVSILRKLRGATRGKPSGDFGQTSFS